MHLERVITVSCDTFIDREKEEFKAVVITVVQCLHDIRKDRGIYYYVYQHQRIFGVRAASPTFSSRCSYCYSITRTK